MNALGKIVIVAVVLILLFVITMLAIGHVSNDYGWNFYLNVNDADKPPYKEYISGNSSEKTIYTNDHSLGQLYSTPLGGSGVPGDKILYTKMHVDEVNYPNPTKRVDLRESRLNSDTLTPTIDPVGGIVNPNAVIIQPGTTPDYSIHTKGPTHDGVFGVEKGFRYSYEGGNRTVYLDNGTVVTTFADGSKRAVTIDGKEEQTSSTGIVASTDSANQFLIVVGGDGAVSAKDAAKDAAADAAKDAAADAEITENYEVPNIEGFEEFSKTFKAKRIAEGFIKGEPYSKESMEKCTGAPFGSSFEAPFGSSFEAPFGSSTETVATTALAKLATSAAVSRFPIDDVDGIDDIVDSIGVIDQPDPEYIYEIELENVLVDDLFSGNSDREGLTTYMDSFYVDAAGDRVYRRRRRETVGGWSGSYVDLNGNTHHHGAFEIVRRARPVRGWSLPHNRRRNITVTSVSTWEPHNHKIKIEPIPRLFDSSFNSSSSEFLTDSIIRHNPVGDLIVKHQPVFDSVYMLQ